jgi:hypothetical protein
MGIKIPDSLGGQMNTEDKRGDIHKNYFCGTAGMSDCPDKGNCALCPDCHRKWPTPKMFLQEYGIEYPDDGAVYLRKGILDSYDGTEPRTATYMWVIETYNYAKGFKKHSPMLVEGIVCACTPWGKPPEDWEQV